MQSIVRLNTMYYGYYTVNNIQFLIMTQLVNYSFKVSNSPNLLCHLKCLSFYISITSAAIFQYLTHNYYCFVRVKQKI